MKKKAVIAVVIVLLIAVFGVTMYVTNQRMQAEYEANVEEFNRGADSLRWETGITDRLAPGRTAVRRESRSFFDFGGWTGAFGGRFARAPFPRRRGEGAARRT